MKISSSQQQQKAISKKISALAFTKFKNRELKFLFNDKSLIFLALTFFIIYKFCLITLAFSGRNLVPEPDDSYTYISLINVVYEKGLFSDSPAIPASSYLHMLYTPYVVTLAILAKVLALTPEEIFKVSFYFGTIFLALVLTYFLKNFTSNNKLVAFTIFFLALYNGSGNYHGFYWVVPSFFAFALFLILFTQLISKSGYWYVWVIFTTLLFVLIHPISIYATSIFIFWPVALSLIERKIEWAKFIRGSFIVLSSIIWFSLSRIYFLSKGIVIESESSYLGVKRAFLDYLGFLDRYIHTAGDLPGKISSSKGLTAETISEVMPFSYIQQDNWEIMKIEYLDILLPNPLLMLVFVTFLFVLIKKKQYWVLALYLATVLFLMVSTVTWFGYRSLGYLWPATFILLSHGIFFTMQFLHSKFKELFWRFLTVTMYLGIIAVVLSLGTLNFIWAKNLNLANDLVLNKDCPKFLLANTKKGEKINYEGKTAYAIFLSAGLFQRNANLIDANQQVGEYLVSAVNRKPQFYTPKNPLLKLLVSKTSRRNLSFVKEDVYSEPVRRYNSQNPIKDCGDFKIYIIEKT